MEGGSIPPVPPNAVGKAMSQLDQTTFLYGPNATFIAELYSRYLDDPNSVDASWRSFFGDLSEEGASVLKELEGPAWGRAARSHVIVNGHAAPAGNGHAATALAQVAPVE